MKELDFKEAVVNDCKNYLSEHLTNDEIYRNIVTYSADALDSILGLGFDFAIMQNVLVFYLLNSKDSEDIKRENASRISNFTDAAQIIVRGNIQLGILNKALFDMTEKNKPV